MVQNDLNPGGAFSLVRSQSAFVLSRADNTLSARDQAHRLLPRAEYWALIPLS